MIFPDSRSVTFTYLSSPPERSFAPSQVHCTSFTPAECLTDTSSPGVSNTDHMRAVWSREAEARR